MEKKQWSKESFYNYSDVLSQFAETYADKVNAPFDFGTGEAFTGYETHMVSYIADNPGVCLTELANHTMRTKGAVSIMLKKLETKGLIARAKAYDGSKLVRLYVTPKGAQLDEVHKTRDKELGEQLYSNFLSHYSDEEINIFFDMLSAFLDHLQNS